MGRENGRFCNLTPEETTIRPGAFGHGHGREAQKELSRRRRAWRRVELGNSGHFIQVGEVDPEIMKQMPPPGSKPFTQVGIVEFYVRELRKLFRQNK